MTFQLRMVLSVTLALAAAWNGRAVAQTTQPTTAASSSTTQPARPEQTPVLSEKTVLRADVPYGGPDAALNTLDVYAPKDASGAPILLFVHGGEWTRGDKKAVSSKPLFCNDHGIVFVSTNFRLSPKDKHPAQVDDVATAIAWVHAHATEFGGDPAKIVIMGNSAGCHLVTLVALDPAPLAKVGMKPADLRGVVAWSGGMYDLVARAKAPGTYPPFIKATFGESEESQRAASPIAHVVNAKTSPPFLFASVEDQRPQSAREASDEMAKLINDNGGKAESKTLAGKTHFTANHELGAPGDEMGVILLQFVESVTE